MKIIILVFLVLPLSAFAQEVAVISNLGAPSLTKEEIKSLYLGFRTSLPDGTRAIVIVPKTDGVRDKFFKEVVGISYADFKSHWLTKALAGESVPVVEVPMGEINNKVKEEKGAIGFVPAEKVTEGVRVLFKLK